jgi:tetratricopeptide (TPR) repeat protein
MLVCVVAAAGGAVVISQRLQSSTPRAAESSARAGTFFPTEQLSIVKDITAAIANMGAVAGAGPNATMPGVRQVPRSDSALARFEVAPTGGPSTVVNITDHIWAPAAYVPFATAAAGTASSCSELPPRILDALLHPSRDVIQQENARVSARLRENIRCADAHAEAALLVGTLVLREAAKAFNDPRRLISRMSAHLAVADALGISRENTTRRMADIVLLTVVGRQRSALDTMDALAGGAGPPVQSWIRALRTRNTFDWRIVPDLNRATLLEQLQVVRAADASLGDPRTLDFIETIVARADVPDWGRIVMQGNPGVEAGNRFADTAVALELIEAAEARKAYAPAVPLDGAEALIKELKVEPAPGPVAADGTVWVIDWPMWAAAAERHLINSINARDTHLGNVVSLQPEAKEFREQVAATFSGLRLYPLLAITVAPTKQEARPAMAAAVALLQTHPELVTHWMWKSVLMKETWSGLPKPIPRLESWFTPPFPAGTVFDVNTRPWPANLVAQFTPAEIAPYRAAAPYAGQLPFVTIGPEYEKAPASVLTKEFGQMADFNLGFAVRIANALKDNPDAYAAAMEKVVRIGPERLVDLAVYHVQHERFDAARSAYERWFAIGRNEVGIANCAEWMVRDYFERGQLAKAAALADRAAATYSGRGLLTRARLHEWTGRLAEAERYYRLAYTRYDDPDELLGFLVRQHRRGMEVDALTWRVFPAGIARVTLPSLREPPTSGVEVAGVERLGERYNLHVNDIIVAVDGIQVQDLAQYYAAKSAGLDPVMRLVIWRDLQYQEVGGPLRYGGLWGSVKNYVPGTKLPPSKPRRW